MKKRVYCKAKKKFYMHKIYDNGGRPSFSEKMVRKDQFI